MEFDYISNVDSNAKKLTLGVGEVFLVELEAEEPLGSASEIEIHLLELEDKADDNLLYNPMNPFKDYRFREEPWSQLFSGATWPGYKIKTSLLTVMRILLSVDRVSKLKAFW